MLVRYVMWDLDGSPTTIEELRAYLADESVDAFSRVPGLRYKAWIADEATNRWGAVYLCESKEASQRPLPSRARADREGPRREEWFEVEASIEGLFDSAELSRRGRAFEVGP